MIVLWGRDLLQIYNDAYRDLMGGKHPSGLGQPTRECWPEVWEFNKPIYARVLAGEALTFTDQMFPIARHGYIEEAHFTLCYSPLRAEAGAVEGVLVTVFETTERLKGDASRRATEARMLELFRQAPAFFALLRGPDHVFEMTNPRYQELIGLREVLGKPLREALPEAAEQGFTTVLDQVYRSGEPFIAQAARIDLGRGSEQPSESRYLDFVYQPLREVDGSVSGIIVLGVDVTAAREAAEALAVIQAELRWTLESSPQAPWTADADGQILSFSLLWLELTGLSREQALSGEWARALHADDVARVADAWSHAVRTGEPYDIEERIRTPSGAYRWVRSRALPRRHGRGHVLRWYGTSEDIHDRKLAEEALLESEKLAVVGRLASVIAHEINNPLEAVTNLIYLARGCDEPAAIEMYLKQTEQELRRISVITSQTLRFHKQSTRQEIIRCDDLIASALLIYEAKLRNSHASVEQRTRALTPIICFEGEVRQVMTNLIGNAIDALPQEGGRILIRSRDGTNRHSGRSGLIITIADNGSGMDPETKDKIFEAFFTTKGIGGTGLGLWISCEIIKRHGGSLRFRSSKEKGKHGTVFTLFLPH